MARYAVIIHFERFGSQDTMHNFTTIPKATKFAWKELDSVSHLRGEKGFEIINVDTGESVRKVGYVGNSRHRRSSGVMF